MKLEPVTKLDKKNKASSKKFSDSVMSENCDINVIFPSSDKFGEIQKPDFGRIVCKTYNFNNSDLLSDKNCKQN